MGTKINSFGFLSTQPVALINQGYTSFIECVKLKVVGSWASGRW